MLPSDRVSEGSDKPVGCEPCSGCDCLTVREARWWLGLLALTGLLHLVSWTLSGCCGESLEIEFL